MSTHEMNLGGRRAFTLIELLVVMLVIVMLAGVTFKAGRALQNRARIQQAKADIARLVAALERFYADHGYYPPGGNTTVASTGINSKDFVQSFGYTEVGRGNAGGHGGIALWSYLDEECTYRRDRRSYISGWPKDRVGAISSGSYVMGYYKDPWGNPYRYITVTGNLEDRNAYMIASSGPDETGGGNNPGQDDIWAGTGVGGEQMGR